MTAPQFDDLIEVLRSALLSAQRSVRQRQQALLEQCCERDENGVLRSKTLNFSIPSDIDDGSYQVLTLPLLSLRKLQQPQVVEITVSFDCEFILQRRGCGATPQYRMRLAGKKRWWRRTQHRVEISFRGSEAPVGKVKVDGILLKEILPPESGRSI